MRRTADHLRARRFADLVPKAPSKNLKRLAAHACCEALLNVTRDKNKRRQLRLV